MKERRVVWTDEMEDPEEGWASVDWKEASVDVFEEIDKLLEPFGLEVVMGDNRDDQFWFRIEKREPA